jgi:hypothetical protein
LHSGGLHPADGKLRDMNTLNFAIVLALVAGAASGAGTRLDPKQAQGALGGRIQYPQGVAPAMRICAIAGDAQRCIDSPAGRTLYRIGELPDGDYQVVARVQDPQLPVAGHVHEVQCIRAPCNAQLVTLSVTGGKDIATADLNGFYAERPDFPLLSE